jgi:uncharacterized tellurite resistance protein B-like protein
MCDAMLSDGLADAAELDLLARLTEAFGLSDEEFQPYFEVIALKNDKTVLGVFDAAKLATQQATPHLAMAASLIYMMASDGSLGPEEIGRLQTMIGEFEGLQKVAVKYALKVKSDQFYASASRFLDADQKIFILANVCDIMLADGTEEASEKAVFQSVRTSFGYTEEAFEPYYQAVAAKNLKSFTTDDFTYTRDSSLADDSDPDDVFNIPGTSIHATANTGGQGGSRPSIGRSVSRSMRANIVKVSNDFGSAKKLSRIADNSHFGTSVADDDAHDGFISRGPDRFGGPSFDAEPSQTTARIPIGSAGRGQASDTRRPRSVLQLANRVRVPEADTRDSAPRPLLAHAPELAATGEGPASAATHRRRRLNARTHRQSAATEPGALEEPIQQADAKQRQAKSRLDFNALINARERLKASHAANASIREQLDHYDATGTLLRSPAASSQQAAGPSERPASMPIPLLKRPTRSLGWMAWRVAVPFAVVCSVLTAGTATVMASLAAPQPTTTRS